MNNVLRFILLRLGLKRETHLFNNACTMGYPLRYESGGAGSGSQ